MAEPDTAPAAGGAPPADAAKKKKQKQYTMVAVAAGALGLLYFVVKDRSSAATTAATSTTPTLTGASAGTSSDGSNQITDYLSQLQAGQTSALAGFQTSLNTLTSEMTASTGTPSTSVAPDYSGETLSGTGYMLPSGIDSIMGLNGTTYAAVPNVPAAQSILDAGGTLYDQPTKGNFLPAPPGGSPGTQTATPTQLFVAQPG